MPSLKERMAALAGNNKPAAGASPARPAHAAIPVPTPTGKLMRKGFIKRSAGESKLTAVLFTRFTELYSDPILLFFDDEGRTVPKGGFELTAAHRAILNGNVCSIEPPEGVKAKSLKLQATSEELAKEWHADLVAALATSFPKDAPAKEATPASTQPAAAAAAAS